MGSTDFDAKSSPTITTKRRGAPLDTEPAMGAIDETRGEDAIDETRGDFGGARNETENRERPGRLLAKAGEATAGKAERMVRNVRERAEESSRFAIEAVKDNPIPAAMVGIGLAWLFMNRRGSADASSQRLRSGESSRESSIGEGEGNDGAIERATEYGREKVGQIKQGAEEAAGRIRETSERVSRRARRQVETVENRFDSMMNDNPLAVGAAALGLGFAIALALPGTKREDELFGRVRERVIEGTRSKALGAIEKGQQKLSAAAELVAGGESRR